MQEEHKFKFLSNRELEYINSIPKKVREVLDAEIKANPNLKEVGFRFWGGELFLKDWDYLYKETYRDLFAKVRNVMDVFYPNIKYHFHTTTKLFPSVDTTDMVDMWRIYDFLVQEKFTSLACSMDPKGDIDIQMMNTLFKMSRGGELKISASMVLNIHAIECLLYSAFWLQVFEHMHSNNIPVIFNWEIQAREGGFYDNDSRLARLFKFYIDKNVKGINIIDKIISTHKSKQFEGRECECKYLPNIFPDFTTKNCAQCFSNKGDEYFYGDNFAKIINEDNVSDIKAMLGMDKRGCHTCEYSEYCPMMCWCAALSMKHPVKCPIQSTYEYLDQKLNS